MALLSLIILLSVILSIVCNIVTSKGNQSLRRLQNVTIPDTDISQLRYLTLGASATYGATLPDRTTGYPYQLSPNVTNLAIRASGPNYPSICTQSMIGDGIYDVIVLEYLMACGEGLDVLAQRLRTRFPDAVIIFNMMWVPTLITGKDHFNRDTSFQTLWDKHNFVRPITPQHTSTITSEMSKFELNPSFMKGVIALHKKINNAVNGHLFGLDEINTIEWDNKAWVVDRLSLFYDHVHYSQKGHDFVSKGIQRILLNLSHKISNNLGTWGDGDSCQMWYNTGKVTIIYSPVKDIKLKEFSQSKYALEIPPQGGQLTVVNPFPDPRQLLITYMTTGPTHSNYPKVEITINQAYDKSFIIHPLATEHRFRVHIAKTTRLGMIPPGESEVFIKPIEENNTHVIFPFRVVAVAVVGEADPNHNFAPGPPAAIDWGHSTHF